MRFKIDKNFDVVFAAMENNQGLTKEDAAVKFCKAFWDAGLLDGTPEDNFGLTINEACCDKYVKDVYFVMAECLYGDEDFDIRADVYDKFCELVILGDGNCPDCGHDMEFMGMDGYLEPSGDRDIPDNIINTGYIYKCPFCDKILITENEL